MNTKTLVGISSVLLFCTAVAARASDIVLKRDRVIPVVINDDLSMSKSQPGDLFSATVDGDLDVPNGSRFEGRIVSIVPASDGKPAYMDLEFNSLTIPGGTRVNLHALPMSLKSDAIVRDREGRMTARKKPDANADRSVVGGLIAGLLVGLVLKKPFEGAFVGALAGIIVAESNRADAQSADLVIKRGDKMGALIDKDTTIQFTDSWKNGQTENSKERDADTRIRPGDERQPADEREIKISFGGKELSFERGAKAYRIGKTVMVPLEKIAGQLDLTITKIEGVQSILLEDDENIARVQMDTKEFRLNGKRNTLESAAIFRDGITYVPLTLLAAIKRDPISLNGVVIKPN